jgi:hypothetical protein
VSHCDGDVAQLAIEEHAARDLAAGIGITADARRVHGHRRPIPGLLRFRPGAVCARAQQRAHPRADALSQRLGIEPDERLLDGLARVAVAFFSARPQVCVDRGEAPRHRRVQLDQTRFAAGSAPAPAVFARLARAAASDLHVLAQAALLDRDGEGHERQIGRRPQGSILVVDCVGVRHAVLEFGSVELRAQQLFRRASEGARDGGIATLGVFGRLLHYPGIVKIRPRCRFGLRGRLDGELGSSRRHLLEHEREKQGFEIHWLNAKSRQ